MKKYLALGLLSTLLLTSCSVDWNDEKKAQNDLFEKKQECIKYKDEMLKDAEDIHKEWMNITWDLYDLKIEEIFYSKNYNSCIYQLSIYKFEDIGEWMQKFLLNKYLYDYFTQKEIISTASTNSEETSIKEKEFSKKFKELKWE